MLDGRSEMPRWVSALVGIIFVLPFGLILAMCSGMILFELRSEYLVQQLLGSATLMGMASAVFALTYRLVRGKRSGRDKLLSPIMLRICAGFFFILPLIALVLALNAGKFEVQGFALSLLSLWCAAYGCWTLAEKRSH